MKPTADQLLTLSSVLQTLEDAGLNATDLYCFGRVSDLQSELTNPGMTLNELITLDEDCALDDTSWISELYSRMRQL